MTVYSFEEVNGIYSCSDGTNVKVHSVSSPNLQIFNKNVVQLFKTLKEDGRDDFWETIIREIKRFRFDLSAAPLSPKVITEKSLNISEFLKKNTPYCEMLYSSSQSCILAQLSYQARQLADSKESTLLDFFTIFINNERVEKAVIVVCEPRLIPEVEEIIKVGNGLQNFKVVSPANLRENNCYTKMFVFGAPRWFPEFIFSAPRSKEIHVIKHKWISGNWSPEFLLISPYKSHEYGSHRLEIKDESTEFTELTPEDLIPRIDIKKILDEATEQLVHYVDTDEDIVIAKLYLLENDWGVFLEADDSSSVDIIDLDEEAKKRVRRAKVSELQPGMFILLRTEGGGDYIVSVADRIMEKFKDKARADQKWWKTALREQVKRKSATIVINELRQLGATRATSLNLDHWMSFRGIRTENYNDFFAIMKLIGLKEEALKYWETMNEIRRAHTRAGFTIRSMLLELVNKSDLDKLTRYGKMEFVLAEEGAGSLSAFRVKEVSKETTEVIHWRIGEVFRIDSG